ncbi:uncharacterized mitochondrial protein AtMg00310-like [Rutidosis leptorrhynchoides]|uniref:uncharacterized mitochondrial protein AtMg00310-like n=1 Tax=Rutidosis leptorrhynchoides TaxID=125765 RepID=UPI003A995884
MYVISLMQLYWQSIFIIPSSILKEIETLMRGFLWSQGELKRGKAKVKWAIVCLPKVEGGLGIKRLKEWNVALMTSHIWRLITNPQSLWVQWINTYRLKGHNFWNYPEVAGVSVGWRKRISIRDQVCYHFIHEIGDETHTSAWYDVWCDVGPLEKFITSREIHCDGFNILTIVKDIMSVDGWAWPSYWLSKYPQLQLIQRPSISDKADVIKWNHWSGDLEGFAVGSVWDTIHTRANKVDWYSLV